MAKRRSLQEREERPVDQLFVNSKNVSEDESKKIKRSYMLSEEQIEKIMLLKVKSKKKDYSTIVGEAIDFYFENN